MRECEANKGNATETEHETSSYNSNTIAYLNLEDLALAEGALDEAVAEAVGPGQAPVGRLRVVVVLVHLQGKGMRGGVRRGEREKR